MLDQPVPTREGTVATPKYQTIHDALLAIIDGLPAGSPMPTERELCQTYAVSRATIRQALGQLEIEQRIFRRQGKGTFVAPHAEQRVQFRFLRLTPDDDALPAAMQRRLVDCRRVRAPADVARALRLRTSEPVIRVQRILSFRGAPVVLDDIWLPAALFNGLTMERLAAHRGPMYGLFESEFGVRMIRAEEKIRAVAAGSDCAQLLGVASDAPLLSVERRSMTYEDAPVELRKGLYNTAHHYYRNELN